MSQQGVGEIERGQVQNSMSMVMLAHVLGVNAYWLETGIGTPDDVAELSDAERMVVTVMRQLTPSQLKGFLAFMSPEQPK